MTTLYSARDYGPIWLALATAQTTRLEVYRDGALVAPSAGTYTLTDPAGAVVVDAAGITVSGSAATYALLSSHVSNTALLGEGWQETWSLTLASEAYVIGRPAALTRSRLSPVVTDADLTELYSDLAGLRASNETSFQRYIDAAWKKIVGDLYSLGQWPYLIMDPWALRDVHLHRTLELIWRDYGATAGDGSNYLEMAREHGKSAYHAWKGLSFRYDADLSGRMDSSVRTRAAQSTLYTSAPPLSTSWDL